MSERERNVFKVCNEWTSAVLVCVLMCPRSSCKYSWLQQFALSLVSDQCHTQRERGYEIASHYLWSVCLCVNSCYFLTKTNTRKTNKWDESGSARVCSSGSAANTWHPRRFKPCLSHPPVFALTCPLCLPLYFLAILSINKFKIWRVIRILHFI